MRKIPSLNGLKAFESAARHESFTRAADELSVTQGAVSHQVKALEAELGIRLFIRKPRRLEITAAGRDYLDVIRDALDRIDEGTRRLRQRQSATALTVSISPNFASKWLVHRLGRFAGKHPAVDLHVRAEPEHIDFARADVDISIRHGDGLWRGLSVTRLCHEELFPVCAPTQKQTALSLAEPRDLQEHSLLHLDHREDWRKWLDVAGVTGIDLSKGPVLDSASMVIDAAVNGQGIALARTALVAHDLIEGRLIRPFKLSLPVNYAYWIVCPEATATLPKIEIFRSWLMEEAARDALALAQLDMPGSSRPPITSGSGG